MAHRTLLNFRARRAMSLAVLLVAISCLVIDVPAGATAGATSTRLAGTDRVLTAIAVSEDLWSADEASAVVLARSDNFADALAGGPLAVAKNSPLLLTASTDLDARTAGEVDRVLTAGGTVYLLGGTSALSPAVEQQIQSRGYITVRYGGVNRFDTAVIVNRDGLGNPSTLFVADGLSFQDPLIAAATAPSVGGGVVLTAGAAMPSETSAYISARSDATRYAVGAAARAADPGATGIGASDPYNTARLVAEQFFTHPDAVALALGTNYPDALAGGAHIGSIGAPLLLTPTNALSSEADNYLRAKAATLTKGFIYGGTSAISADVEQQFIAGMRDTFTFGEGTYRVGADIPAGTYRTRSDASGCYWERLSGFSGEFDDTIANEFTNFHTVVEIDPSDAGFKSDGCATWTSDLSTITSSPTAPFANGIWIVNTDIASGTWQAPGGGSCYWERLSGFSGEFDDTIANDFGSTNPTVAISASDAGFKSGDCGSWTKIG